MQRTINEIYELLKQKKENAINDRERTRKNNYQYVNGVKVYHVSNKEYELKGEIDAYTDIICLIESSGLVNQDKTKS